MHIIWSLGTRHEVSKEEKKLQIRHQDPRMRVTQKLQEELWESQALQTLTVRPEEGAALLAEVVH